MTKSRRGVAKEAINEAIEKITSEGGTATLLGGGVYWSSSEVYNDDAWYQNFIDGFQYRYGKAKSISVRAIRAFNN